MYKNKTELYGRKFPFGLYQNNIDEVEKKHNLPNDQKIMKTLISQIIMTGKYHVLYLQGGGFQIRC